MRKMQFSVGATLALVLAAGTAIAHHKLPDGIHEAKAANGAKVLADAKGMTLYTFDKDTPGKSVCKDKCAVNWPPVLASAGAEAEPTKGSRCMAGSKTRNPEKPRAME